MTRIEQTYCIELGKEHGVYCRPRVVNGVRGVQVTGLRGIGHLATSVYTFAVSYIEAHQEGTLT